MNTNSERNQRIYQALSAKSRDTGIPAAEREAFAEKAAEVRQRIDDAGFASVMHQPNQSKEFLLVTGRRRRSYVSMAMFVVTSTISLALIGVEVILLIETIRTGSYQLGTFAMLSMLIAFGEIWLDCWRAIR